jgi:uncharacterized protein involved in outer membrane biogenesis
MKKTVKILVGILIFLLVIVVVASFFLGDIVKGAVNTAGPLALGVPVELQSAKVLPLSGLARLNGFSVGNPEGFKSDYLFKVDLLSVKLKTASLMSDRIHIERIHIKAPQVMYEMKGLHSNIGALLASLEKEEDDEKKPASASKKKGSPKKGGKGIQIDEILIEGGRLSVKTVATLGAPVTVPLPTIHITGIGAEEKGGASPVEVAAHIVSSLVKAAGTAAAGAVKGTGALVGDAGSLALDGAGATADMAMKGADAATDAAVDTASKGAKAVGGAAKGLLRGAGGLLGGKDD